jgi:hypothetical protein
MALCAGRQGEGQVGCPVASSLEQLIRVRRKTRLSSETVIADATVTIVLLVASLLPPSRSSSRLYASSGTSKASCFGPMSCAMDDPGDHHDGGNRRSSRLLLGMAVPVAVTARPGEVKAA